MSQGLNLEMLVKLMELAGAQRNQQIDTALKPRGQITQSPKNIQRSPGLAGWYELNPQARQGETYQQEQRRIRREQQVPAGKLPGPTAAPAAKNQQGGSFTSWLSGLFGGGSPKAEAGPRVNKLTGLPFGTLPGDPAYQDQLVQGAPKAMPVLNDSTDPTAMDLYNNITQSGALDAFKQAQEMLAQRNSPEFPNSPAIGINPPGLPGPVSLMRPPAAPKAAVPVQAQGLSPEAQAILDRHSLKNAALGPGLIRIGQMGQDMANEYNQVQQAEPGSPPLVGTGRAAMKGLKKLPLGPMSAFRFWFSNP